MSRRITRRKLLQTTAAASAGITILRNPASAWSAQANEKINVALVGVGGRGEWFLDAIPRMQTIVAICDVSQQKLDGAFKYWDDFGKRYSASAQSWEQNAGAAFLRLVNNRPKTFADFRIMLGEMDKSIDAVVVATPDHTHAAVSAAAIRAGKHVFCEKPLTRTVHEARALRELARKHKVATTMGNQGTYSGPFRRALELIRRGDLGEIKEVHVWNTGGGADQKALPQGAVPVPAWLNWDLWLGPAAMRPYHPLWIRRHNWREFGTCQLGNWAPHSANLGFMSLMLQDLWLAESPAPRPTIRVESQTSGINRLSFPKWARVRWHVAARSGLPPITINWYNGEFPEAQALRERATAGASDRDKAAWQFAGTLIVGTKGTIHSTGHNMSFRLLPEDQFKDVQRNKPEIVDNTRGCEQDWFVACRGGKPAWSNFDHASAFAEFLMLGNIATQFEQPLDYDPASARIVNNKEADALLSSPYREGWSL